jgi:ubiquinone biosynthesis protein
MKLIKKGLRLIYIAYILNKFNVIDVLYDDPLLKILKLTRYINVFYWSNQYKHLNRGERLRLALEALGPIFVKFGQALSTRPDLMPIDISEELGKLQDKVPPFSKEEAITIIESSLEQSLEYICYDFNPKPLASASIAQVHTATLKENHQKVIIKVLRPNIQKILENDTDLLKTLANMIENYIPSSRRFKPVDVINEISKDLFNELDLIREAANASQLKRNFADSEILYIPEVYWNYCHHNILTMEKINGVQANDITTLKSYDVDMKLLAERGVNIFYTQVFRDCFFHADMHPGNIFIDVTNPKDPKYIAIDFGIIGTLSKEDQHYLASNFLAFFNRDYKKVAELHVESGWVPPNTRIEELECAVRTVCEPIFEKPLNEISFGHTLMRLFQVAKQFQMEVQPQLILLQKTLLNVEGMGRQIYPELNLWKTARPFLVQWMKSHAGFKGFWQRVKEQTPQLSEKLPEFPNMLIETTHYFKQIQRRQLIQLNAEQKKQNQEEKYKSQSKTRYLLLFLGIGLLIYALLYTEIDEFWGYLESLSEINAQSLGILGIIIIIWYILTKPGK